MARAHSARGLRQVQQALRPALVELGEPLIWRERRALLVGQAHRTLLSGDAAPVRAPRTASTGLVGSILTSITPAK